MKNYFFLSLLLIGVSCTKTPLIPAPENTVSNIIAKTSYTDGNAGSIEADFISSDNQISFSQNLVDERDTLKVTFITKTRNFDSLIWVFQGADPITTTGSITYTVSTTNFLGNSIEEQSVFGGIKTTIPFSVTVPYRNFGKFDVFHGASNSRVLDTEQSEDYVEIFYKDNRENWEAWESAGTVGWAFPPEGTFSTCLESLVAFYTNTEVTRIAKPYTGFGSGRKNLIFEFKYDFQIFPNQDMGSPKLGLSMYPSSSIPAGLSSEDIPALWEDGNPDRTVFRQVVVELPQVEEFTLVFTKYLGDLNASDLSKYPFTACIRNLRIVPAD